MLFLKKHKKFFAVLLFISMFLGSIGQINCFGFKSIFSFNKKSCIKRSNRRPGIAFFDNKKIIKKKSLLKPVIITSLVGAGFFIAYKFIKNRIIAQQIIAQQDQVAMNQNGDNKSSIIYDDRYNIGFLGFERLHPFDSKKYGRAYRSIMTHGTGIDERRIIKPGIATDQDLRVVHTQEYLDSLNNSGNALRIAELVPGGFLQMLTGWFVPGFIVKDKLLDHMKRATAGTVLASRLAVQRHENYINIGGGYHHAKRNGGGGFCFFADIPLAVKKLWETNPELKVMVVDLDAHQGNGHESVFGNDGDIVVTKRHVELNEKGAIVIKEPEFDKNNKVAIFDVYGAAIYPGDFDSARFIKYNHPVEINMGDKDYLDLIEKELPIAVAEFKPNLIIYNAGTDILQGDRLGRFNVSMDGIVARDEKVFRIARENGGVPVCMVTSGGYTNRSADAISRSVNNLIDKGYIHN